jgi:hypothetical protein
MKKGKNVPKVSINKEGNRLYLDYEGTAINWFYSDADIEVGLSAEHTLSYISIELKSKLAIEIVKEIVKPIKKGEEK